MDDSYDCARRSRRVSTWRNIFNPLALTAIALFGANTVMAQVQPHWTYSAGTGRITHTPSGWQLAVSVANGIELTVISCAAGPTAPAAPTAATLPLGDPVKDYKIVGIANGSGTGGIMGTFHTRMSGLTLPNTLTRIGSDAFKDSPSFTGPVIIPDGVTSLGAFAFKGTGITALSLPTQGLNFDASVSDLVFQCTSLKAIYWRGPFPTGITPAFLIADNSGKAGFTNYVESAHVTSWNAGGNGGGSAGWSTEVSPKLPASNAMWMKFPIRVGEWDVSAILNPPAPVTYDVNFDKGNPGATGSMPSLTYTNFVTYTLPPNGFTYPGYTFNGWTNALSSGMVYPNQRSVVNLSATGGVVTLIATWLQSTPRTLTYASGFGATVSAGSHPQGSYVEAKDADTFQRTGYTLSGWTSAATGLVAPNGIFIMPSANTTLTAVWTPITYTVTFIHGEGDGDDNTGIITGTAFTQSFTYDQPQALTPFSALDFDNPKTPGYTFAGWVDQDRNVFYDDGAIVNNLTATPDDTLIFEAKWALTTYYVAFDGNGADNASTPMPNQQFTYGVAQPLDKNQYVKTGHTFMGWDRAGTLYADEQEVKNLTMDGSVVTLTATWRPNTYRVAFAAGGGTGTMSQQTFVYDVPANLNNMSFTREGYTFAGWTNLNYTVGGVGAASYANQAPILNLTTQDNVTVMTLTALWTPYTFYVAFDPGAGTGDGTGKDMTFLFDTAQNLTAIATLGFGPPDQIHDWVFAGWTINGTTVAFADEELVKNLTTTPFGTVTLTALWAKTPFYVAFDGNGADNATPPMSIQTIPYGEEAPLDKNLYVRAGWEFVGWRDAAGTFYYDEQIVKNLTMKGDTVTLYAQWALPYVSEGNEWLHIDVIQVDTASGNVTLEWNVDNMKDTVLRALPFHYEIHATDDLRKPLDQWVIYVENAGFTRNYAADPIHSTELNATALSLSPSKMFFRLRAVR